MKRSISILSVVVAGLLIWAGCDAFGFERDETGPDDEPGSITVELTDAPGDIAEAIVTIERVELVPANEDSSVVVLSNEDQTLDLLTLQDGVTETIADTELPQGVYEQMRFVVAESSTIRLEDGTELDLKVPSGTETGLKIVLPAFQVTSSNDEVSILLDFSVADSFVPAGASGMYIFKPVVRAERITINGSAVELVDVSGQITAVNTSSRSIAVDGIPVRVPSEAEISGPDGSLTLAELTVDRYVDVEVTRRSSTNFAAREIAFQDEGEEDRSVEAPLESVGVDVINLLSVPFAVNASTTFDDVSGLDDLEAGDRVDVEYTVDGEGNRIALNIDREAN
jgi:hypothetical protein